MWLSVAALIGGFTALGLEIGHPFRMIWTLPTGMQYVSPMFWMGLFYTLYLVLLLGKFQRIHAGDWHSPLSHALGLASFVSVVIAHSTLGLVFGMMTMRPLWYDGMISIYFLVMAAVSGGAFAVLFTYVAHDFKQENMPKALRALATGTALPKVFATMIGIGIMMIVDRTITGLWANLDGFEVYAELLRSPLWQLAFWLGLVVPFVAMVMPSTQRQAKWQIRSSVLVILAMAIVFFLLRRRRPAGADVQGRLGAGPGGVHAVTRRVGGGARRRVPGAHDLRDRREAFQPRRRARRKD